MQILVMDLETQNHIFNKRKASQFCTDNYIVQIGWQLNGGEIFEKYFEHNHRNPVLPDLSNVDMLVGHNIKFDLLWVWKEPELMKFLKKGGRIWDTQYVEYLLEGMLPHSQMNSMNDIAVQYGGGLKIDAVKEMWEAGVLTADIDRQLLTDYLVGDGKEIVGDIQNTWLIFKGQVAKAKERGDNFLAMLRHRMDGLLATTEMEFNGMHVDLEIGEAERLVLIEEIELAKQHLEQFIPTLPPELEFNWGSPQQKSCLIFGGTVKYKKFVEHKDEMGNLIYPLKNTPYPLFNNNPVSPLHKEVQWDESEKLYFVEQGEERLYQDTFKGGKQQGQGKTKLHKEPDLSKPPKGALQDHFFTFPGFTKPHHMWKGEATDAKDQPLYSTSAEVIEKLAERGLPFTDALSDWTGKSKNLGTFYWIGEGNKKKGMLTLVQENGIVHHSLNHTSTITSRMSSTNPNLQNIPRGSTSNVKKMFRSRFPDGKMAEVDYSQLEVVVQGVLTHDKQLRADLNNKMDFHCLRLASVENKPYQEVWDLCHVKGDPTWKTKRQKAKIFSFQRAYGAGVDKIARSTGMSKEEVQALIAAEEKMYPSTVMFDNLLEKTIERNRYDSGERLYIDGVQFPKGESYWDAPTGTRYSWQEGIAPQFMHERGKFVGFSPTERKNYPVQGTGGEIVQTMLGKVFRHFVANDMYNGEVLLVNSVHDCVLLDGTNERIGDVALTVQSILEDVPAVFNAAFPKLKIDVPFPCETEVGDDLFTMTKLKREK